MTLRSSFASLLFAAACSSAYADQPVATPVAGAIPQQAIAIAPAKIRAPYDVEVIREDGDTSPTYAQKDRFYVLGQTGERYTIRITNPTAHRVEAVVTVDGLDVIDGEAGDLHKRGYIVPAYGETRIEGFRTSQADVATFRFSSVDGSYAGQKGKARNVGVIAAAIFEEEVPVEQQIVGTNDRPSPPPPPYGPRRPYDYRDDLSQPHPSAPAKAPAADKKEAERPASVSRAPSAPAGAGGGYAPRQHLGDDADEGYYRPEPAKPAPSRRPGLGTEFGEQRYSAATYTRFVRAHERPIAVAELRYNDAQGLMALGIPVAPIPDDGEIMTRETADPFPGDNRFARPPR